METTILNISTEEIHDKGFKYYNQLGISIQRSDAIKILKEISNIIKLYNYTMEIKIKLTNDEIIYFNI